MSVCKEHLTLTSHGKTPTFINITAELRAAITESGIQEGIAAVISPHTTCAVFFEEFVHDVDEHGTEFLQNDLNAALEKIIPNQPGGASTSTREKNITEQWSVGPMPNAICRAVTTPRSGTVTHILKRPSSVPQKPLKSQTENSVLARRVTVTLLTSTAHAHEREHVRLS